MIVKNLANFNNDAMKETFMQAIEWEKCDMLLTLNTEAIKKQESIINSETATLDEIKVAEDKKSRLEKDQLTLKSSKELNNEAHETVIASVISCSNEFTANTENAIRNYLRLSCCDDNSKFFKLAILTDETFGVFYDYLVALHNMKGLQDNGLKAYTKEDVALADELSESIQGLVKKIFSVPLENEVTKKINVKFNRTDMNIIHETFVTGVSVDVKKSKKDDSTKVEGVSFRYAIERVENKKTGSVEYRGARFKEILAKLAFNKLFKVSDAKTQAKIDKLLAMTVERGASPSEQATAEAKLEKLLAE